MKKTIFLAVGAAALLAGCGGGGGSNGGGGSFTPCTGGSACNGKPAAPSTAPTSAAPAAVLGHWTGALAGLQTDIHINGTITAGTNVTGVMSIVSGGTAQGSPLLSFNSFTGGVDQHLHLDISTTANETSFAPGYGNPNVYNRFIGDLTVQPNGHLTGTVVDEECEVSPSQMLNGNGGEAVDLAPAA